MLVNLHVKNLALIRDIDISFGEGLNILTGETGAGKSIILGSINAALGGKVSSDLIRTGADHALVELVFQTEDPHVRHCLQKEDISFENGQIIISRKITNGHSISKVNGVTVTLSKLRQITSDLVDIHGQHDHQSLLNKSRHIEILDTYGGTEIADLAGQVSDKYREIRRLKQELEGYNLDEEQRLREMSLYEYELNEIDNAHLIIDEDESLESEYKKLSNGMKIMEVLSSVESLNIGDEMGEAVKSLKNISNYDERLQEHYDQLLELESIFSDFMRGINLYMGEFSYDEQAVYEVENRLNLINKMKSKYGKSISKILAYGEEAASRLEVLKDFETRKSCLENVIEKEMAKLTEIAISLSVLRKEAAERLEKEIRKSLEDLNFNDVRFEIEFVPLAEASQKGIDGVEFMISTNPGEPIRPLKDVASGGELSRIMLAIKTIMAQKDNINTLIFDEIDTGISGRTAGQVARKLSHVSRNHQVICITHLPQIASMADLHFRIDKRVNEGATIVEVNRLDREESIDELSRILGGIHITDTVRHNASEMLDEAEKLKKSFTPV
ncbi:DNA repair protein RecN [Parasporobacterium paucivorans]|uniref:DNA repair protein RecN n=1 Tax=Parasporobacterium paucivorans DSM 15970 TaxID=1122934 RepID=A0A1M6FAB7_9FIRM|nr:DNA repair protein RecN [Parasporobacterium paucivorans]SHI94613.1 DNA repair protein RecN (Recombination protein N) [Parasporobacterium paucivorans DSM 15970]